MTSKLRVLGIATSLRQGSFNAALLDAMAVRAPAGLEVTIHRDLTSIPVFNEDLEDGAGPPAVLELRAAVAASQGLIIVTPEYNQSIPGATKNLVDWLSRGDERVLDGRAVAIAGATPGPWGTRLAQATLRHTLTACGSLVMPLPQIYVRSAADMFGPDRALRDERLDASLRKFMLAFAGWMEKVAGA